MMCVYLCKCVGGLHLVGLSSVGRLWGCVDCPANFTRVINICNNNNKKNNNLF